MEHEDEGQKFAQTIDPFASRPENSVLKKQPSNDVFNKSSEGAPKGGAHASKDLRMQAYGGNDLEPHQKERYVTGDDYVLTSQDMTIMSAKLNVTGVNLKKTKFSDRSQAEDGGRLDTCEDEFDVD